MAKTAFLEYIFHTHITSPMSDANPPRGPLAMGASSGAPGSKAPPRHPASNSGADLGDTSAFPLLRRRSTRIDGVAAPSPAVRYTEPLTAVTTEVTDAATGMPMLGDASHQSSCAYTNAAAQARLDFHQACSPGLGIVGSPSSWSTVVMHGLVDDDHSTSRPPGCAGAGVSPRSQRQPPPPPPPPQQQHQQLRQQEVTNRNPLEASVPSPCPEDAAVLSPELKFLAERQRLYPEQQQHSLLQQQTQHKEQERGREEREEEAASQASLGDLASLSSHAIHPSEDQGSMSDVEITGQSGVAGSSSKMGGEGAPGGWWPFNRGQGGNSKASRSPKRKGTHAGMPDDTKQQLALASNKIQHLQREIAQKLEEISSSRKDHAAALKAVNSGKAAVERANLDLRQNLSEAQRNSQSLNADLSSVNKRLQQALSVAQKQKDSLLRKDAQIREKEAEVEGLEEQLGMARQESSNAEFALLVSSSDVHTLVLLCLS